VEQLYDKQQEAFDLLCKENGGVGWMRVGAGKTRVGILAALFLTNQRNCPVILCVCRRSSFYDPWTTEVATLQLNVDVKQIEEFECDHSFKPKRPTLVLISEGKLINKRTINQMLYLVEHEIAGALILDEGWLYKNPKAQKHIAITNFARHLPTILLSGSIMPKRDLVDIYGQITAAGRGPTLARSLTDFRAKYQMGISGNFFAWYPKPGAYMEIMQKVRPYTYIYFPKDHERKIHETVKKIPLTAEQKDYIEQLKHYAEIESEKVNFQLNSMSAVIIKAQQISDGWVRSPDGTIDYVDSNKIDVCVDMVEDIIAGGERVVVWCAFREDIRRLMPYMEKIAPVATLQSGDRFNLELWNINQPVIALATEASGTSINHFAQVPYGIYFSQDWKWRSLEQSQGRHTRHNSQHETAYFTFLHCDRSLDARVYGTVRSAQSSEKSFLKKMEILDWIHGKKAN
jgi:hypothetical protein